ncbi:chondroitin 4-O-sulfotransferase [Halioglobus maricola]|uniref:Chondroitin 4-O-sulfotransferase n=1 Tax=Halioglobus maricola TaxID=2601894 RepID=A0A5P9NQG5_9GAMM|nr:chondroitin 4-O-sulfotransferase [Halioglobus maricola]
MLWRLMPAQERKMLLSYAPQYQQRHIERIIKGKAIYQPCFDDHKALFIHVPKSAGRSVVRGMFDVKSVEHAPADWYQQLDPDKYRRYFKFTFVRNPWDRALSAYTYLHKGGSAASEEDSHWSEFVRSFESFDAFVLDWMTPENIRRNALFTPQIVFLRNMFGQIDMDYVGRFENLQEDFISIAQALGVERTLPHLNQSRSEPYQTAYSMDSRQRVAQVYAEDIDAFGYRYD